MWTAGPPRLGLYSTLPFLSSPSESGGGGVEGWEAFVIAVISRTQKKGMQFCCLGWVPGNVPCPFLEHSPPRTLMPYCEETQATL